jgi:alkanesulfonate monooxygenase SsuD/methylene tetrahydromethanopterin reductase-like flavin-dependent oxidoreductase (luciferase family)
MRRAALLGDGWMPYLYSSERYAESVAAIKSHAAEMEKPLESFAWMAYIMVSVDRDPQVARQRAATFLGTTYSQDVSDFIGRIAVTATLTQTVDLLREFVRAGARHLVLLPCRDSQALGSDSLPSWLPELVQRVRASV